MYNPIRALTHMYSNLETFNPLVNYLFYLWTEIYDRYQLTPEEYASMVWSFEFNTKTRRVRT